MSKKKPAVLIPESQLTDAELAEVSGGLLPAINVTRPRFDLPRFERPALSPLAAGDGCGTDDSGAMGCPG